MRQIFYTPASDGITTSFNEVIPTLYNRDEQELPLNNYVVSEYLCGTLVVQQAGEPVARAALYLNPELRYNNRITMCLGNVECVNETDTFNELIQVAAKEAGKWGCNFLLGPMSGSTWYNHRFSFQTGEPLFFTETYHKAYYPGLMLSAGFEEVGAYYSSIDEDMVIDSEKVLRVEQRFLDAGYRIREINLDAFEQEIANMHEFLNAGFAQNFLFTPIDKSRLLELYMPLKPFLKKELILIAENPAGSVVGVSLNMPDYYDHKKETFIIKTLVVRQDKNLAGLGTVLGNAGYRAGIKMGFKKCIHAFMRESGYSVKTSVRYSGKKFRQYKLYGKNI